MDEVAGMDQGALIGFAAAAARNALDLLSDAELLCAGQRWARAYALAVLAVEELGKASGVLTLALVPPALRAQVPVRDLLGRHDVKQAAGLVMHLLEFGKPGVAARVENAPRLSDQLAQLAGEVGESNQAKQRGFYVDLISGELKQPSEVTEADARAAMARAWEVAESAGPLRDPEALAVLADPPPEVLRFAGLTLERYLESADLGGPEAAAAVAVELARVVRRSTTNA
jgi:AbiV family abortive infection protein